MGTIIRSAVLQMRVTPGVKRASEEVMRRIGLTMTEAVELFLRRVIMDQCLPFDVAALDNETFFSVIENWTEEPTISMSRNQKKATRDQSRHPRRE